MPESWAGTSESQVPLFLLDCGGFGRGLHSCFKAEELQPNHEGREGARRKCSEEVMFHVEHPPPAVRMFHVEHHWEEVSRSPWPCRFETFSTRNTHGMADTTTNRTGIKTAPGQSGECGLEKVELKLALARRMLARGKPQFGSEGYRREAPGDRPSRRVQPQPAGYP